MTTEANNKLRTYNNAVAIITGGASGIGWALGKELAAQGCEVVLADIQLEQAEQAAQLICEAGGKATAWRLDVTDARAFTSLVEKTVARCGRLDYMFNNAGIALNGKFYDFTLTDWQKCIDINLMGVVHGIYAAYAVMAKQGFGHIVNTASFAGIFPWASTIAYTASKHAIVGMSASLRAELLDTGIQVSVICPGTISTPMITKGASQERWAGNYSQEKLQKFFADAKGMDPDLFAKKALKKIARNKAVIVIPNAYRVLWWFNRISPAMAIGLSHQIYKAIFKRIE